MSNSGIKLVYPSGPAEPGLRVVYYCYGSAHSSIVCAAIHLGRLTGNRVRGRDIVQLADYDATEPWSIGTVYFKGVDDLGHPVYTLGLGPRREAALEAVIALLALPGFQTVPILFAEALSQIGPVARMGGALSRRYGMVKWGRPLSAWAIARRIDEMRSFVDRVREAERQAAIDAPAPLLS
ncbi:DUF3189 family protein [Kyrpidia spormannii]|uniref:Uncharacterized protein n=2 Tax=Kyrpidia spormannii TaxID=2055160 RepID=A0ACA8Z8X3_9BACL|nr:DUF3189 family protein [Kyrpidia spormannii]CAB3391990.1 conserved protein of unknown function [Kyrpidia spormannii]CAB3392907.1 conserved protein of unknown function [Kyrpidia spormannii]